MRIANPIYDAVFKYLMTSDIKVAKLIIPSLINKPVLELTVDPTEIVINKDRTSKINRHLKELLAIFVKVKKNRTKCSVFENKN
jgi:hypothetical protein